MHRTTLYHKDLFSQNVNGAKVEKQWSRCCCTFWLEEFDLGLLRTPWRQALAANLQSEEYTISIFLQLLSFSQPAFMAIKSKELLFTACFLLFNEIRIICIVSWQKMEESTKAKKTKGKNNGSGGGLGCHFHSHMKLNQPFFIADNSLFYWESDHLFSRNWFFPPKKQIAYNTT